MGAIVDYSKDARAWLSGDGDDCAVCPVARARFVATGGEVQCVCERWFPPRELEARPALVPPPPAAEAAAPRRATRPGAAPDVYVADEARLRPSSAAPVARLTHAEEPELVDVRCLLVELRPERGGPFGWPPDGTPPEGMGSSWSPSLGVQTSVEVPAILPTAFVSLSPVTRAPNFDTGFGISDLADDVRATLRWLQRYGTLADGLTDLYVACAEAIAPADVQAKWEGKPKHTAKMLHGRKRTRVAMAWWWGRALDVEAEGSSNKETPAVVTAVEVRPAGADAEPTT